MALNYIHNKKLATLSLIAAMAIFVIVFNVHTDDDCAQNGQFSNHLAIMQAANLHHTNCAACELFSLGAGDSQIASFVTFSANVIVTAYVIDAEQIIVSAFSQKLTSRAPPF